MRRILALIFGLVCFPIIEAIQNLPVYDEEGNYIGKLRDMPQPRSPENQI